ncbi:hypothetical protein [Cohnella endophytica]|uniref:hypothetical protein n=1 Tax=Cohnella endophytica TaxID=2419778 RepID=UPI001314F218|nr:hypothetical protein [Cohnella endophytica]
MIIVLNVGYNKGVGESADSGGEDNDADKRRRRQTTMPTNNDADKQRCRQTTMPTNDTD